jgi:hypothetical protein
LGLENIHTGTTPVVLSNIIKSTCIWLQTYIRVYYNQYRLSDYKEGIQSSNCSPIQSSKSVTGIPSSMCWAAGALILPRTTTFASIISGGWTTQGERRWPSPSLAAPETPSSSTMARAACVSALPRRRWRVVGHCRCDVTGLHPPLPPPEMRRVRLGLVVAGRQWRGSTATAWSLHSSVARTVWFVVKV